VLQKLDRALMAVEEVTAWLAGAVIFLIMLLVTAEVLLRRLFNSPIPGQVDVTVLGMIAFSVLCISYCYRRAGHIRMDLLQKATRGRLMWATQLCATLLALFTITAILPGTWAHFMRAYQFGDTTMGIGLSTWPSKLAVPVGLGIFWLRLALEVWVYARLVADPDAEQIAVPRAPDPVDAVDA